MVKARTKSCTHLRRSKRIAAKYGKDKKPVRLGRSQRLKRNIISEGRRQTTKVQAEKMSHALLLPSLPSQDIKTSTIVPPTLTPSTQSPNHMSTCSPMELTTKNQVAAVKVSCPTDFEMTQPTSHPTRSGLKEVRSTPKADATITKDPVTMPAPPTPVSKQVKKVQPSRKRPASERTVASRLYFEDSTCLLSQPLPILPRRPKPSLFYHAFTIVWNITCKMANALVPQSTQHSQPTHSITTSWSPQSPSWP